ncbi:hypothetical protein K7432_017739 [Basidiobolus ranarum]|uniref:Uncharacterized protein n=1 Tax=Basidiobolus ranarum TaxID=34480 RepID=A0ABR2WD11_9FUNG
MRIIIAFALLITATSAWDINKSSAECKGITVPGILDTRTGSFLGGRSKSNCVVKYCTCSVQASGSILPPRVRSFQCSDGKCKYTAVFNSGLQLRRVKSSECVAETLQESDCS